MTQENERKHTTAVHIYKISQIHFAIHDRGLHPSILYIHIGFFCAIAVNFILNGQVFFRLFYCHCVHIRVCFSNSPYIYLSICAYAGKILIESML